MTNWIENYEKIINRIRNLCVILKLQRVEEKKKKNNNNQEIYRKILDPQSTIYFVSNTNELRSWLNHTQQCWKKDKYIKLKTSYLKTIAYNVSFKTQDKQTIFIDDKLPTYRKPSASCIFNPLVFSWPFFRRFWLGWHTHTLAVDLFTLFMRKKYTKKTLINIRWITKFHFTLSI